MRMIPYKETLEVEFKSDMKSYPDRELVEDVVGMANAIGGSIYMGVEDDGTITGVHPHHADTVGVVAMIANTTVPSLAVRAELLKEGGIEVLRIDVPRSRAIVSTATGRTLKRRLKADGTPEVAPLFSYEIPSRLSELGLLDISAQPLAGATMDDFDPSQHQRLRRIIQTRDGGDKALLSLSDEELDRALRLVAREGETEVPTVAGMLILGKEERIAELMPTAKAAFQVLEGTSVRVNVENSKPLLELFEDYETYMEAWNPEREMEYGLFRIPVPEFSKSAFREGLVNAFCHRDYSALGSVRVLVDDEGLTISNPGGFIDGVSLENLLTVEPHGRNPALADALKRIGLAEKTGRGIDRIYEGSILYGRPWPDYTESTGSTVKLFLQRAKADMAFTKMIADEQNRQGKPLSINTLMVLSLLKNERRADIERIVEVTNIRENRIRVTLENMIEQGLIEATGRGKQRSFVMSAKLYNESKEAIGYVRQTGIDKVKNPALVLQLAKVQNGIIAKKDVCDLLNVTPSQAYSIIKELMNEGKLELLYGGKYAKYRLVE